MLLPPYVRRSPRLPRLALLTLVLMLGWPCLSSACDWGHRDIAERFEAHTDVLVGRVTESPFVRDASGAVRSRRSGSGYGNIRVDVEARYKGTALADISVDVGLGDCRALFVDGERYLIFGVMQNGILHTSAPSESLSLSASVGAHEKQQAALAIQYGEARAAGRPVTLVEGLLQLSPSAPSVDQMTVRADGHVRSESGLVKVNVDLYSYGLVLPPGDYELSGVRAGVRITDVTSVRLSDRHGTKLEPLTVGARVGNRVK